MSHPTQDTRPPRVVVYAFALLGLGAALALVRPDLMLVEQVSFEGTRRATAPALRHLVDLPNGTTIWGADLARAERGAARHPWVRTADARRVWPDRVVVRVEEYTPVALLQLDGLWYLDAEGTPFLRAQSDLIDLPVITGLRPSHEEAHPALPRTVARDALALIDALDVRGLVPRDRVSEVVFSETRGFTVHLVRGARLVFAFDDVDRQLHRLAVMLDGHLDLDRRVQVDLAPGSVAIVRPLDPPGSES